MRRLLAAALSGTLAVTTLVLPGLPAHAGATHASATSQVQARVLTPGERLAIYPPRTVSRNQMSAIFPALNKIATRALTNNGTVRVTDETGQGGSIRVNGSRMILSLVEAGNRLDMYIDKRKGSVRLPAYQLYRQSGLTKAKWDAAVKKAGLKPAAYVSLDDAVETNDLLKLTEGPLTNMKPTRWSWRQTRSITEWTIHGVASSEGKKTPGVLTLRVDRQGNPTYLMMSETKDSRTTLRVTPGNPTMPAAAFTGRSFNMLEVFAILMAAGLDPEGGSSVVGSALAQAKRA